MFFVGIAGYLRMRKYIYEFAILNNTAVADRLVIRLVTESIHLDNWFWYFSVLIFFIFKVFIPH